MSVLLSRQQCTMQGRRDGNVLGGNGSVDLLICICGRLLLPRGLRHVFFTGLAGGDVTVINILQGCTAIKRGSLHSKLPMTTELKLAKPQKSMWERCRIGVASGADRPQSVSGWPGREGTLQRQTLLPAVAHLRH